jgi:hypothetical protein
LIFKKGTTHQFSDRFYFNASTCPQYFYNRQMLIRNIPNRHQPGLRLTEDYGRALARYLVGHTEQDEFMGGEHQSLLLLHFRSE